MAEIKFLDYIRAGREIRCKTVHGKCLLQYYCSNVTTGGKFFKSMLDICAETTICERTVRRLNNNLKGMGVLTWIEGRPGKANEYTLHIGKMREYVEQTANSREASRDRQRHQWAERSRRYRERQAAIRHASNDRDGSA